MTPRLVAEHPHTPTAIRWIAGHPDLATFAREARARVKARGKATNCNEDTQVGDLLRLYCLQLAGADPERDARRWPREAPEGVPLSAFLLHHKVNWTEAAQRLEMALRDG